MAPKCSTTAARDGCVVETDRLAEIISPFIDQWQRDRPPTAGQFGHKHEIQPVTAIEWLAQETGALGAPVSQQTIEGIVRPRANAARTRPRATELRIADALVAAVGVSPGVFRDGTLQVFKNPQASREARDACCGGSLLGSARRYDF